MPTLLVTTREATELALQGRPGQSVMTVIRDNDVGELAAICGGCCSCGTCHVYVDLAFADRLPPIGEDEEDMLDTSPHRRPNSRLSCQIPFSQALDGLKVTIAPED